VGGRSKKVTVGYKYYLGMHMILCHGPVDKILRIKVDTKDAWVGDRKSGRIYVNNPELFGGESREGGVQGAVDFEPGGPGQGVNDYLQSRLGGLVPAFRGVAGVVLRQVYLGLNPYLKRWSFRLQRIHTRQNGVAQWYYPRAEIKVASNFKTRQMFYFALDKSGSMDTLIGGQSRLRIAKDQLKDVLDSINQMRIDSKVQVDICIVGWSGGTTTMTRYNAQTSDFVDLRNFVEGIVTDGGGTNFNSAFEIADSFFQPSSSDSRRRAMFFITDGEPTPVSSVDDAVANHGDMISRSGAYEVNQVDIFAINIDLNNTSYTALIDNTPQDGIPVVDSANSRALYDAVFFAVMGDSSAMNPAHIIRECLTDPDWGMGYSDTDVDDQSFMKAADTLYAERMGISVLWDRQKSIEDFISDIVRHIDAALYVDRKTGLFTLKLIRGDYNKPDLIHLNEDNIDRVENFSRPAFGELVNAVTVNYWNVNTGRDASVTAQDIALQQMQGVTIGTTMQYPGFVDPSIASRVAQRDLNSLSTQRATCTIYADRTAKDLTVGSVFRWSWADYNINDVVMRVTGIAYGDGKTNRIRLTCTEDVFDLPAVPPVEPQPPAWEDPNSPPTIITKQIAFEAPYLELVQTQGQTTVDTDLATNPDLGYVGAACGRPNSASIQARMFTAGVSDTQFEEVGLIDFCPTATVVGALSRFATTIPITNGVDLDMLELPCWAQIGSELVWVESITGTSSITVRRCILDTTPQTHPDGAVIYFWDLYGAGSPTEYVTSETVRVKLASVTGLGQLNPDLAPELPVVIQGRAARPYRPANLRINGELDVDPNDNVTYPAVATWVDRNRLQETGGVPLAWTDGDVVPEAGTTYEVTMLGETEDGSQVQFFQQDIGALKTYTIDLLEHTIPDGSAILVFQVRAVRDGLKSWRPAELKLPLLMPPSNMAAKTGNLFAPVDVEAYAVGGGV